MKIDTARIKAANDIVALVQENIELKKKGKDYWACCPFHRERTPSFTVVPDKQIFHCFGCGASGDALTWVQEFFLMPFPQACAELERRAGLSPDFEPGMDDPMFYNQEPPGLRRKNDRLLLADLYVLGLAATSEWETSKKDQVRVAKAVDSILEKFPRRYATAAGPPDMQGRGPISVDLDIVADQIEWRIGKNRNLPASTIEQDAARRVYADLKQIKSEALCR